MSISMDLGPKGLAAMNACEYKFFLDIDKMPDNAHGCDRGFEASIRGIGLQGFWMIMLVVWNTEFSPEREHARKHQLSESMAALMKKSTPATCPLFLNMCNDIGECYRLLGHQFENDSGPLFQREVWNLLSKEPFAPSGFYRCNTNRFMGSLHTGSHRVKRWDIDRFERSFMAVELDLLGCRKVIEKITMPRSAVEVVAEGGGSTSSTRLCFEDRATMTFAQNAVVCSVVMLSNLDNRRIVETICLAAAPVLDWHTVQAGRLKDAISNEEWVLAQLEGDLMKHIGLHSGSL